MPPPPARFQLVSNRQATRAPIGPSVIVENARDLRLAPERVNRCVELIAPAPPGDRWVQFVPTLHARLRPDLTIEAYGFVNDDGAFDAATDGLADRFRDAFAEVIGQAVRRGASVSLLPHLDAAGGPVSEWRNLFRFAPAETIGAGSYESLLIGPLADAIESEATSDTRIDLALSGEMGQSLFEHPADYLRLVRRLRERFASNPRTAGVRIGVALNWKGLAGESERFAIDRPAVAELFAALDFVGFSCYAPLRVSPTTDNFASATKNFLNELRRMGGDLAPSSRLVFSEVGIGGGAVRHEGDGAVYATPAEAAARPYEGEGPLGVSPWRDPQLAELRRDYHAALCDYLTSGADDLPPIDKAFLWSNGPWDPQGVTEAGQRDEAIAAMIDRHNAG